MVKITIKSLPPSKNIYGNWHWGKKDRYYKSIREEIWYEMVRQNVKKYKMLEKAQIIFRLYFRTNRKRDSQNYLGGGLIAVLDSLADLDIIKDDNYSVIGDPIVELYVDKANPRMEIIIDGRV